MILELIEQLAQIQGSRFANITYTNKMGGKVLTPETARFQLILGADTANMYQSEIAKLESFSPMDAIEAMARDEILASRRESLNVGIGNNSAYTNAETYYTFPTLRGVRIHKTTGEVYVSGHQISKTVIVAGTFKMTKSAPKTIAKAHIAKTLGFAKFRLFTLDNITRAALNGNVLEVDNG